jgi:hypothetical protein
MQSSPKGTNKATSASGVRVRVEAEPPPQHVRLLGIAIPAGQDRHAHPFTRDADALGTDRRKAPTAARPRNPPATSRPAPGTALAVLGELPMKGRAPQAGYNRDEFGQTWLDTNRTGCDTRSDILARDLTTLTVTPGTNGCRVEAGTLADPCTGTLIRYVRGNDTDAGLRGPRARLEAHGGMPAPCARCASPCGDGDLRSIPDQCHPEHVRTSTPRSPRPH